MKQLIKTVLPRPWLIAALDMRDTAKLAAISPIPFDANSLAPANSLALGSIFSSSEIEAGWNSDHGEIKALFGNDDLFGGINPGDRRALYFLIRGLKPQNVLEVGTHIGASTLHIARALRANGGGKMTTVDIIDVNGAEGPWKQVGLSRTPHDLAKELGCADLITFTDKGSLPFMQKTQERFDFIFLDGDHTSPTVYREVAAALSVLKPGGTILLHDYYPEAKPLFPDRNIIHGPFRALARAARENPDIRVMPLGELPWPTKQGSRVTSLALLTRNNGARSS